MYDEPTFLVQVGHNGHVRAEKALRQDYADGAVLSPADYNYEKNRNYGETFSNLGGDVFFDPQFYIPRTDRPDMTTYPYFSGHGGADFSTAMYSSQSERIELCEEILEVQDKCSVDGYISPARYIDSISPENLDRWLDLTETFIEAARDIGRDIPIFASLPVNGFELTENRRRNDLLNRVTSLDPDGFYVSVQHDDLDTRLPLKGVDNVYSYLKLMASLRSNRFEVIAAHTHQIAHLLLGIGVNVYASGHYQNLRAFDSDRWIPTDEDEIRQQVVRYYSDELLDALRVDSDLDELATDGSFDVSKVRSNSPFEEDLFDSQTSPAGTGWKFSDASWEHYVYTCGQIADRYRGINFEERYANAREKIESAENLYEEIRSDVNPMESVDDSIYHDWSTSLEQVRSELSDTKMKMLLGD